MTSAERRARFERALRWGGSTHTVEDVVRLVKSGRAKWWDNGEGCIVTELLRFPQYAAVNFWLISGELRACLALEDEILEDALREGAEIAMATGRAGWGRVAAPTGWRPHMHTFWKPLTRELPDPRSAMP